MENFTAELTTAIEDWNNEVLLQQDHLEPLTTRFDGKISKAEAKLLLHLLTSVVTKAGILAKMVLSQALEGRLETAGHV